MEACRKRYNTFPGLKEKNSQPQILYLAKLPFRNEEKIKILSEEGTQKESVASRSILKDWLKGIY